MPTASLRYCKRFQMELDLRRWRRPLAFVPSQYRLTPWAPHLAEAHARVKHLSFRDELDGLLFPVLRSLASCRRLIEDISLRDGFVPEATWLAEYASTEYAKSLPCGTIQAIRAPRRTAFIQNIGVVPAHRSRGVGAALVIAALWGLQHVGVTKAALEVTAENDGAVQLYRRLGFRTTKTLFKELATAARA